MIILRLLLGLFLLIKCADIFVEGSSSLAKCLRVPSIIIGLTIVAFGTSMPELAVSLTSSIYHESSIAMENIIGSNTCNLLLILGLSSLFKKIRIDKEILCRDYMFYLLSLVVLIMLIIKPFLYNTYISKLTIIDGILLLILELIYLKILFKKQTKSKEEKLPFKVIYILYIIVGIIGVTLGGNVVVDNSIKLAKIIGINKGIIAFTIVAIGTSLPELVTSVIAAKKGEIDLVLGNVIGSNIFNTLFILGISSILGNIVINITIFKDLIFLLIVSILILIIFIKNKTIYKRNSYLFLLIYFSYILYILIR